VVRSLARGLLTALLLLTACASRPVVRPTPTPVAPASTPIPATPALATPTSVPAPIPTLAPSATPTPPSLRVANTGGNGANLRDAPATGRVLIILSDGALVAVVGPDQQASGKTWKEVRDGAGHVGWIVADYLVAGVATPGPAPSTCRAGDPLANVYHPGRLTVLQTCETAAGTVAVVRHGADGGDYVGLLPDEPSRRLLNDRNVSALGGLLVVEIVPADEPGCTVGQPPKPAHGNYDFGVCTGANIALPSIGAHVTVVGPYVRDEGHGWAEIHPAWTLAPDGGIAQAVPQLAAVATALAGADAADETAATATPVSSPTALPLVPITPSFVGVSGGRPGPTATVTVQAAPGALCSIAYAMPVGTPGAAQGLVAKRADSTGRVNWVWVIGTQTTPGMGTVAVTCDGATAATQIAIG
jgi:hypothetical protein